MQLNGMIVAFVLIMLVLNVDSLQLDKPTPTSIKSSVKASVILPIRAAMFTVTAGIASVSSFTNQAAYAKEQFECVDFRPLS